MNGKSKSILLQVAFKKAVDASPGGTVADVGGLAQSYYDILISLHTANSIDADDAPRGGGGGGGGGYTPKPKTAPPASARAFTLADGSQWIDYRASKVDGSVKPRFPDFKTADGKDSVYEFGLDGSPTPQFAELAAAADGVASLTDPF